MAFVTAELKGDLEVDLSRFGKKAEGVVASGAAAMARVIVDEVRLNASGAKPDTPGIVTGNLSSSIYWARNTDLTTETRKAYSISWNKRKAPHGHLIEYGHWRVNVVFKNEKGELIATKKRLAAPVWVPAYPFVRPAESKLPAAVRAGLDRMRERLAEEKA